MQQYKWDKRIKKTLDPLWYPPVSIAFLGYFCKIVFLRKILRENAYKIYHVYKAMAVLHSCNGILDIPSTRYPGNKNQILMLIIYTRIT